MNSKFWTLVAVIAATWSGPAWATTIFSDDFSTFTPGNLVGQHSWVQTVGATTLPLQVAGGNVVIPDNQTADNQDAAKVIPLQTSTVYAGMSLNFSSAPASGPSYFFAFFESSGGFANARLTAIDNSANVPGTYLLETRYTGQAGNPFVAGAPLFYGQTYNVVEKAIITPTGAGEGIQLYVNPTSNNEADQTPYVDTISQTTTGQVIPPVGFNGVTISQFANTTTTHNAGVAIDHMIVATTFGEAANVVPEPATCALLALGALVFASSRKSSRAC